MSVWFSKRYFNFTATVSFFHQLITSKDEIDVIYIDFRKAFDSVPHNELLIKLWNIGITGTLWKRFESYLSDRSQCVSINNSLSKCLPVLSGVSQGSIPYRPLESDIQLFQNDLTSLSHWSVNNHLSFNISKFVFMHFHNKFNSEYTIRGNVIPHSSSCRDLGINLSDNFILEVTLSNYYL